MGELKFAASSKLQSIIALKSRSSLNVYHQIIHIALAISTGTCKRKYIAVKNMKFGKKMEFGWLLLMTVEGQNGYDKQINHTLKCTTAAFSSPPFPEVELIIHISLTNIHNRFISVNK